MLAGSLHPSACNASGRDVASVHRCALARLAADGEGALRRLDPKARRNARKDDERALDCDGPTRRLAALAFAQDIVCLGYNASGAAWKCDRGVGGVSYESGGGAPWLPRAARPLGG